MRSRSAPVAGSLRRLCVLFGPTSLAQFSVQCFSSRSDAYLQLSTLGGGLACESTSVLHVCVHLHSHDDPPPHNPRSISSAHGSAVASIRSVALASGIMSSILSINDVLALDVPLLPSLGARGCVPRSRCTSFVKYLYKNGSYRDDTVERERTLSHVVNLRSPLHVCSWIFDRQAVFCILPYVPCSLMASPRGTLRLRASPSVLLDDTLSDVDPTAALELQLTHYAADVDCPLRPQQKRWAYPRRAAGSGTESAYDIGGVAHVPQMWSDRRDVMRSAQGLALAEVPTEPPSTLSRPRDWVCEHVWLLQDVWDEVD